VAFPLVDSYYYTGNARECKRFFRIFSAFASVTALGTANELVAKPMAKNT